MEFDLAVERGVLAGLLQGGEEAWIDLQELNISTDTFSSINQKFFKVMEHEYGKGTKKIDDPTFESVIKKLGFTFDVTDVNYIRALKNYPVDQTNLVKHAAKIRKLHINRLLKNQVSLIQSELEKVTGEEPIDDIISIAEKRVVDFSALLGDNGQTEQIGAGVDEYLLGLEENPDSSVGIPTGFPRYDAAIGGGIRLGTVNLIGARTGQGKSFLTVNVGINVAKQGVPVLILDTEMSKEEQWPRILACMSGVEIRNIESGKLFKNEIDCQKVTRAKQELKTLPISYRVVKGMKFDEILSVIRRWIVKEVKLVDGIANPAIVIYDYFKVMNTEDLKNQDEFRAIGFQLSKFSDMMGKYKVGSLAFTQLNRDGIDKEDLSAISQSDRLTWFCPSVAIFKEKGEGEDNGFNRKLIPLKCRHGEKYSDGDYINMNFIGRIGRILEGPRKSDNIQTNANRPVNDSFGQLDEPF